MDIVVTYITMCTFTQNVVLVDSIPFELRIFFKPGYFKRCLREMAIFMRMVMFPYNSVTHYIPCTRLVLYVHMYAYI